MEIDDLEYECSRCHGTGMIGGYPCITCDGMGSILSEDGQRLLAFLQKWLFTEEEEERQEEG
jgi:DnaJ-class molecular chaperone